MPTPRPPFPAVSGLWGKPTIINNVETLACVGMIMQNTADWFAEYGTDQSKGTKTIALVGKVKNTGLAEVSTSAVESLATRSSKPFKLAVHQVVVFPKDCWIHPSTTTLSTRQEPLWGPEAWLSWMKTPVWSISLATS